MVTVDRYLRRAEIERVKDLVQKERENNIPIYDIVGCRGRSIKVYKDRCIITTDVTLGSLLTNNATDGEKTIFYSDVVGIQYKPRGITIGYIQLETSSGQMNNIQSNQFGENTFTFEDNAGMDEVRDYIIYQISQYKQTCLDFDATVERPVYSFKYDIMTPDRRNKIIEVHLRATRNSWNISVEVQHRSKSVLKAILADLDIKNVFDDVFSLKDVQFLFEQSLSVSQTSKEWICQIPNEYACSISGIDIHIRKIAYEEEIIDVEQIGNSFGDVSCATLDSESQQNTIEEVLREITVCCRAQDMHQYLLSEIEQGTISVPEVDLKNLSETVAAERLYGAMPDDYLKKLEKILKEICSGNVAAISNQGG